MRLQLQLSNIWWLTYKYKNKMSIYANGRKLVMIAKWSWTTYESNISPPSSLLKLKRDDHGYLRGWCILFRILCQVFYNQTLSNSNLPHNRGHGFRKIITLQGCPNLAHHKLSRLAEVINIISSLLILGKSDQARHPGSTRHFDNGKTSPARPPGVSTPW